MSTHRRVHTRALDDEDDEELIPPTAADDGAEALPVEKSAVGARGASPSLEVLLQMASFICCGERGSGRVVWMERLGQNFTKGGNVGAACARGRHFTAKLKVELSSLMDIS
ncbi:unnamed protein product [Lampetra planeri]